MSSDFRVAIVGGGLCGIALAIALKVRGIPFTIYESRSSFTEIGAGIGVGPSALLSLRLIDPKLGEHVYKLSTRNLPPHEEVFLFARYGAACGSHADGASVTEYSSPPTGCMSLHRQEFLAALADYMGLEHAQFNKKLTSYSQSSESSVVQLHFADGSTDTASILVGCDGIHSQVRHAMFGPENPLSRAQYFDEGAYRAVIPIEKLTDAIGPSARRSTIWYGPNGYIIMYPVNGGRAVNCGAWVPRPGPWTQPTWVVPDQHEQMLADFSDWGPTVHRILALYPTDVAFWGAHQHAHQPDSLRDGRVIVIGDGAHAMPPHQGSGAAVALEDAYVLAEVLGELRAGGRGGGVGEVSAALQAVEDVRIPRSAKVHRYSCEARDRWRDFQSLRLEGVELQAWIDESVRRFEWIWNVDLEGEAEKAKARLQETLASHS